MAIRGHRPVAPLLPGVLVKVTPVRRGRWAQGVKEELAGGQGKVTSAEAEGLHTWPVGL